MIPLSLVMTCNYHWFHMAKHNKVMFFEVCDMALDLAFLAGCCHWILPSWNSIPVPMANIHGPFKKKIFYYVCLSDIKLKKNTTGSHALLGYNISRNFMSKATFSNTQKNFIRSYSCLTCFYLVANYKSSLFLFFFLQML